MGESFLVDLVLVPASDATSMLTRKTVASLESTIRTIAPWTKLPLRYSSGASLTKSKCRKFHQVTTCSPSDGTLSRHHRFGRLALTSKSLPARKVSSYKRLFIHIAVAKH